MTFEEFVKDVAKAASVSQIDVSRVLWAIPSVMRNRILNCDGLPPNAPKKYERLIWPNLGTFETRELEQKKRLMPLGYNNTTGKVEAEKVERVTRAQTYVGFRASAHQKVKR